MNLKINRDYAAWGRWKLTDPYRSVGHHQVYQHMCNRMERKEKGAESVFEEMIPKTFPNLMKKLVYTSENSDLHIWEFQVE